MSQQSGNTWPPLDPTDLLRQSTQAQVQAAIRIGDLHEVAVANRSTLTAQEGHLAKLVALEEAKAARRAALAADELEGRRWRRRMLQRTGGALLGLIGPGGLLTWWLMGGATAQPPPAKVEIEVADTAATP